MIAAECLKQLHEIQTKIGKATTTNLIFASKLVVEDSISFSVKHAQIHEKLVDEFKTISTRALNDLCEREIMTYQTGYHLEDSQVMILDLNKHQDVKDLIDQATDIDNLKLVTKDEAFFKNIAFYAIFHAIGNSKILCLSGISPQNVLKKSKKLGLFIKDGFFDQVEENSLIIKKEIDCVSFNGFMFILNLNGFHKLTQYHEEVINSAREVITSAGAKIPIYNLADFMNIGTSDYRMAAKLANIKDKPYIATLTLDKVKKVIQEFNLAIEIKKDKDGTEQLVFEPSPQQRFLILKLLDDDYLHSNMTTNNYTVNSKIPS